MDISAMDVSAKSEKRESKKLPVVTKCNDLDGFLDIGHKVSRCGWTSNDPTISLKAEN